MDIFTLGCVFGFAFARVHPFGSDKDERIVRIKKSYPMTLTVDNLQNAPNPTQLFQLISSMVNADCSLRPSASDVLQSTFFRRSISSTSREFRSKMIQSKGIKVKLFVNFFSTMIISCNNKIILHRGKSSEKLKVMTMSLSSAQHQQQRKLKQVIINSLLFLSFSFGICVDEELALIERPTDLILPGSSATAVTIRRSVINCSFSKNVEGGRMPDVGDLDLSDTAVSDQPSATLPLVISPETPIPLWSQFDGLQEPSSTIALISITNNNLTSTPSLLTGLFSRKLDSSLSAFSYVTPSIQLSPIVR
jgi:hypothetical protein